MIKEFYNYIREASLKDLEYKGKIYYPKSSKHEDWEKFIYECEALKDSVVIFYEKGLEPIHRKIFFKEIKFINGRLNKETKLLDKIPSIIIVDNLSRSHEIDTRYNDGISYYKKHVPSDKNWWMFNSLKEGHEDIDPYGEEVWNEFTFDSWHNILQNMGEIEIDDFEEGQFNYFMFWHKKTGSKFELDIFYNKTMLYYYLNPNSNVLDSKVDEIEIKDCSKEHLLDGMKELILKNTGDIFKNYI